MEYYYSLIYKNCTFENTPIWSLKDKEIFVKVLKVYDGDTVWVALKNKGENLQIES